MSYKIKITPLAKAHITKAKSWYEGQSVGLGELFSQEVKEYIDTLTDERVDHKVVLKSIRRMLLYKFPYVIYYKRYEEEKQITIMSVLHIKQNLPKF